MRKWSLKWVFLILMAALLAAVLTQAELGHEHAGPENQTAVRTQDDS